jgi:hypothetical protein
MSLFTAPLVYEFTSPLLFLRVLSYIPSLHISSSPGLSLPSTLGDFFHLFPLLPPILGIPVVFSDVICCMKSKFLKGKILGVPIVRYSIEPFLYSGDQKYQQLLAALTIVLTSIAGHMTSYQYRHASRFVCSCL